MSEEVSILRGVSVRNLECSLTRPDSIGVRHEDTAGFGVSISQEGIPMKKPNRLGKS